MAPLQQHTDAVMSWLNSVGASDIKVVPNGDVVSAQVPISAVEEQFGVAMCNYVRDKYSIMRTCETETRHMMPEVLREAVDVVLGVSDFPPKLQRSRAHVTEGASPKMVSSRSTDGSPTIERVCLATNLVFVN